LEPALAVARPRRAARVQNALVVEDPEITDLELKLNRVGGVVQHLRESATRRVVLRRDRDAAQLVRGNVAAAFGREVDRAHARGRWGR
jgi:hypothetical protein